MVSPFAIVSRPIETNIQKTATRIAFLLAITCSVLALIIICIRGAGLVTIPIDGCYYLAKAQSLAETGLLRVPWGPTGVDTKFFPGLSILFAPFIKIFGITWGWVLVECACFLGAAWLTGAIALRLGLSRAGAAIAAAAFAVDPLIIKWASVPYAEIPAAFFSLASVEFAFRARDAQRRRASELLAALALGVAGTMRLEAFAVAPAFLAIVASRRAPGPAIAAAASTVAIVALPISAHLGIMNSIGVGPSRLHYVEEFFRNFSAERYFASLATFWQETIYIIPKSKESLVANMGGLAIPFLIARVLAATATMAGAWFLLRGAARRLAACAIVIYVLFTFAHALWHYADARFLILVWPVHCAAVACAVDWMISRASNIKLFNIGGIVAFAIIASGMLLGANHIAGAHASEWTRTTGGSARELAARIDTLVSPDAEGFYEFEIDFTPRAATGPFVAMWRRGKAQFCYNTDNFFSPHIATDSVAELLKSGNRFVMTNLTLAEWLKRRVKAPNSPAGYRALIEERGHTLVVWRPESR